MRKLFILTVILLFFNLVKVFSQVDAPSKLPSERLESNYFIDDSDSYSESQRVTLINDLGDDSSMLQSHINTLSALGGGVITIPEGTWELGEIKVLSNVHLMFHENVIIKPVLSTLNNKSIFIIGYAGASISNVSIRSLSGQFTIDMSDIAYNLRVLPFNIKEVNNFMVAGCYVIDKRTVHSTINCGLSPRNGIWAGAKQGLIKDITVDNAHDGYGAVQVRVGERLYFKNIISLGGGVTLRIETDGHETSGNSAPRSVARISEVSGYNIKCRNGNAAVMIQPWGVKNGWFDVEKIEAVSCMASVRIDRAFVDVNAIDIGNFDEDSRITDVTSVYGETAHIKDGNFKSVPCQIRGQISNTPLEGMGNRFFEGPTIAPVLYKASSTEDNDPRYYRVNIPSEIELANKASNFPQNSLIVSRWSNVRNNCSGDISIKPVTGINVSPVLLNLEVNEVKSLRQIVSPSNATNQGVSWVSNDESVAKVNQWGDVTGVVEGETTIDIFTTDGDYMATTSVNVLDSGLNTDAFNKKPFLVYPNPYFKRKSLNIELPDFIKDNVLISIQNIQGKVIFKKYYKKTLNKISIQPLQLVFPSGFYFISIKNTAVNYTSKLVVN